MMMRYLLALACVALSGASALSLRMLDTYVGNGEYRSVTFGNGDSSDPQILLAYTKEMEYLASIYNEQLSLMVHDEEMSSPDVPLFLEDVLDDFHGTIVEARKMLHEEANGFMQEDIDIKDHWLKAVADIKDADQQEKALRNALVITRLGKEKKLGDGQWTTLQTKIDDDLKAVGSLASAVKQVSITPHTPYRNEIERRRQLNTKNMI